MRLSTDGAFTGVLQRSDARMEEAQRAEGGDESDVDYFFEIPLKTAQSIVGFKHDEECPHISEGSFAVLSRPATKRPSASSSPMTSPPKDRDDNEKEGE